MKLGQHQVAGTLLLPLHVWTYSLQLAGPSVCLSVCLSASAWYYNTYKHRDSASLARSLARSLHSSPSLLADALLHMHERKMMHRDIKPANVFLAGDHGNLKLGDLGLGRLFGSRTLETVTGVHVCVRALACVRVHPGDCHGCVCVCACVFTLETVTGVCVFAI